MTNITLSLDSDELAAGTTVPVIVGVADGSNYRRITLQLVSVEQKKNRLQIIEQVTVSPAELGTGDRPRDLRSSAPLDTARLVRSHALDRNASLFECVEKCHHPAFGA